VADSGCPTDANLNKGLEIIEDQLAPGSCTVTSVICSLSSGCPNSDSNFNSATASDKSSITVNVIDGPIEVTIPVVAGVTPNTFSKLRETPTFNVGSQLFIRNSNNTLESNPYEDMVIAADLYGPGYNRFWVYSTRSAYLEARPWLLGAVSASMIKPPIVRTKLVVAGSQCPKNINLEKEANIWETLVGLLKFNAKTIVASRVVGSSDYTTYTKNSAGAYDEAQVTLMNGNIDLVIAFGISGLLSINVAIILGFIMNKFKNDGQKKYEEYLDKQRNISKAKKEVEKFAFTEGLASILEDTKKKKLKVVKVGVFSAEY
jgi:hypothetical protein